MTPAAKQTLIRIGAASGLVTFLIWLMMALESLTTMVLVSFFIAYILDPWVDRLELWKIPRSVASFLALLGVTAIAVMVMLFVIPQIVEEVRNFAKVAPQYSAKLRSYFLPLLKELDLELPRNWDQLAMMALDGLKDYLPKITDYSAKMAAAIFKSALSVLSSIVHVLMIPILAYYFLVSFDHITTGIEELIPPYAKERILTRLRQIDAIVAGFVRGQLNVCLMLAIAYSLGFWLIGIDLAMVLGVLGGILFIIPYLGTGVALLGATAMAIAQYDVTRAIYVVIWIAIVQLFESYVYTPRVVGGAIGLHPIAYILALMAGYQLFGFVGMLVAIPVAAIIKVFMVAGVEMYRESYLYKDMPRRNGN
jgi:predicted PurR-regulated permease PerM